MRNYFNYFTEIEERFQQRRGSVLLLSTLDWALIETWRDAGIPLEAALRGIDAAFDKYEARQKRARMQRIVDGVCAAAGCTAELVYEEGYVPLVNHQSAVDFAHRVVTSYLGSSAWHADHPRTMGAEDFAFYLERVPGALLRLGLGRDWAPLHSAGFDFNDQSLETGILALAGLALEYCKS